MLTRINASVRYAGENNAPRCAIGWSSPTLLSASYMLRDGARLPAVTRLKALRKLRVGGLLASTLLLGVAAYGQDMEARAYSPAPVGMNLALVSYGHTSGSVLLDPTIPIEDLSAKFNTVSLGYYHSFGLFGRQTSIAGGMPYVWGTASGLVEGVAARTYRSGVGDGRVRFAYFLLGSP